MSTTIKLRRSAVAGRIPTVSQLELGELAINTNDGKIYFKKYDVAANTESIIDISSNLDAAAILAELLTVDGANTGLDADLLDGQHGSYYTDYANALVANTGVTAGTYGSSTAIPVLTIASDGRITLANTAPVAGVDDFTYDSSNNTLLLTTGDGTEYPLKLDTFGEGLDITGDTIITGDATVNGDIIVTGTVDGRDIAADGAKLDTLEDGLDLTLTGKVTGTATANTGVMTLATELANTGVTAGVYGSSTAIPVFTVDEDGRLTTANTTPVAGVDDFSYAAANNTITLETGDGSVFHIQTETEVTLTGKVTGTATATDGNISVATELANTGVTAGTYGTASQIPVLTIDEDGRVTAASNTAVAGVDDVNWYSANNTFAIETGDGSVFNTIIDTFSDVTFNGNVAVTGTVDGRDIAADGLKLDGIEAGATGDQTANEILTLLLTVDGDGSGLDADTVDGYSAQEILDTSANNAQQLIGAGVITIDPGNAITGGGSFNVNTANNITITVNHDDTSSVTDSTNSNGVVIQGLTFDTYGHVQTVSTLDLDGRYYTETELDAGQLDNRYYTETELDSGQLDNRYYTETEADNKFVDVAGDTITGDLEVQGNLSLNHSAFVSAEATTTTTSSTTVYAFPHATYDGAEIIIKVSQGTERHITKLLITHDGTTPIATEFGTVFTNSELASFDLAISGPVVQINATPASTSSTTFNIVGTLIEA